MCEVAACRRRSKWRQTYATFSACLLAVCLGTVKGWTSPMQPLLMLPDNPISKDPLTLESVSWLASIDNLGSIIGSLFCWSILSNRIGRKFSMCLVPVIYIISWSMLLFANSFELLLSARCIMGLADSGVIVNAPVFISEIAEDDLRGFYVSFYKIFQNVGLLYAYVIGTYLKYYGLAVACLFVPFIFLLTFVWLPESPLFHWKNCQTDKAEKSVLWYRGGDVTVTEKTLQKYRLFNSIERNNPSWKSLFATKGSRKSLTLGIAIVTSRQTSGIGIITAYAVNIFETSATAISPFMSAIILACVQLFFSLVSPFIVDRVGRKPLFSGALFVVGISLTSLGAYLFLSCSPSENSFLNWIPLIALSVHLATYSVGLGPTTIVIKSEIFSPELRPHAMSALNVVTCVLYFLSIKLFPFLKGNIGLHGCMWFYGVCSLLFSLFFVWYMPETSKKPHSVIVKIMNGENNTEEDESTTEGLQKGNQLALIGELQNKTCC